MESMFDRVDKMADTQLTKMRWALGLNGLLSIALGVVILLWPGISLEALTILFGAYALATGVVGFFYSFSAIHAPKRVPMQKMPARFFRFRRPGAEWRSWRRVRHARARCLRVRWTARLRR